MKFSEALQELRKKSKKRKFEQTVDLIINLKNFNIKTDQLNVAVVLPFAYAKKKIAAFLESESSGKDVDLVITKDKIDKMTENEAKALVKNYDFLIANAKLMPLIAKKFGKIFGTAGKMPDPSLGAVLTQENEKIVAETSQKLKKIVKIKAKEPSIKIAIGKENMSDEQLEKNMLAILNAVIGALPKKELNIKNIMLKFTMSSPLKIEK